MWRNALPVTDKEKYIVSARDTYVLIPRADIKVFTKQRFRQEDDSCMYRQRLFEHNLKYKLL